MNIATIEVSGVRATAGDHAIIPAGIIGASVSFSFTDSRWNTLTKIAVFQGCVTRDVAITGDSVVIPYETVAEEGGELQVGVYGVDAGQNLVIPTLWATLGVIQQGTDPSGDPAADPSLPLWAELENRMDQIENNLEEQVSECIEDYLQENPMGGVDFETDATLTLKDGVLSVNTTNEMERDNTLPITSAGVYTTVGNIEALLKTI